MKRTRSRSDSIREDEELRLPRAPGLFRRFWARHPLFADILIVGICLLMSFGPVGIVYASAPPRDFAVDLQPLMVVLIVLGCASLLLRRRAPIVPFTAAAVLELVFLIMMREGSTSLVLFGAYALAVYGSTRAAWIGYGISVGAMAALSTLLIAVGVVDLETAGNAVLNCAVLGLIGTLVGVNVGERKRYLAAIIDRSRQLLVERDQQTQLAAASERTRIAREMHDIVSHSLTVIVALAEGAAATRDHEQARATAATAAETARGALTEMRAMLGVLREDDSPVPFAPMEPTPPHDTVAVAQRAGFPATLAVSGSADVSPAVAHAIGRVVQEGVTNAMRHAPRATTIAVRVAYSPEVVTIEVVNDGVSGPIGTDGFGVRGLAERAAHVNGTIRSAPDGGGRWVLRAEFPASGASPASSPTEENA